MSGPPQRAGAAVGLRLALTPRLAVIIVNYNTRDDLRACLRSLHGPEAGALGVHIFVIDNASADGSAAMVRAEFPAVSVIEPGENMWFCGGNNLGLHAAAALEGCAYALMLNPDTIVRPGALTTLVRFMDEHPQYAGCTMRMDYPPETAPGGAGAVAGSHTQRTCSGIATFEYLFLGHTPFGLLMRGRKARADAAHWMSGWARDRDHDVAAMPGSCALFRRLSDGRFPLLDARLRLYFPEDDLARRFAGAKFRFLAAPGIVHREKASTRTARASRLYFRDLIVYTRKHHDPAAAALLWACSLPLQAAIALRWRLRASRES
jgi:GT2 family glycosyltransferase